MSIDAPGWRSHTTVDQDKLVDTLASIGVDIEDILARISLRAYEDGYEQGERDTNQKRDEE
jgi:hypothetical protein